MSFSKIFQILFIVGSTFLIFLSGVPSFSRLYHFKAPSKSLQGFSWSTFQFSHSSFQSVSTIHGGVSCHNSQIMKTEEEFSLNLAPFSSRFMVLACCHPCIIVLIMRILFIHLEHFMSCFLFSFPRSPSSKIYSFQLSSIILSILLVHHSIFSNQFVIPSLTCI